MGFLSAPSNFLAQRFRNVDSNIPILKIIGTEMGRMHKGSRVAALREALCITHYSYVCFIILAVYYRGKQMLDILEKCLDRKHMFKLVSNI